MLMRDRGNISKVAELIANPDKYKQEIEDLDNRQRTVQGMIEDLNKREEALKTERTALNEAAKQNETTHRKLDFELEQVARAHVEICKRENKLAADEDKLHRQGAAQAAREQWLVEREQNLNRRISEIEPKEAQVDNNLRQVDAIKNNYLSRVEAIKNIINRPV